MSFLIKHLITMQLSMQTISTYIRGKKKFRSAQKLPYIIVFVLPLSSGHYKLPVNKEKM